MVNFIIPHMTDSCKSFSCYTNPMIIAVDTGGTKTLVAAFSDTGEIVASEKFPTPRDQQEYIAKTSSAIRDIAQGSPISALCIAVPGVVRSHIAIVCKNLGWRDFDVLGAFRQHFPDTPMWLENDANLGGVGAARLLPEAPERCLYVTISTGIGGGFVVNGALEPSISENEISDIHFEYNGAMTRWGEIANGRAIMRDFGLLANQLENPDDIKEIARRISRGFLTLLPVLRPDIVTVGGGFGAHYALFANHVQQELAVLPEQYHCPIITAKHPEEVVAYGCYFYAKDQLGS